MHGYECVGGINECTQEEEEPVCMDKKKQWHLIKKRKVISLNWVAAVGPLGKQCLCLQVICFTKRKR